VKTKSDNVQTIPFVILFTIEPRKVVVTSQYKQRDKSDGLVEVLSIGAPGTHARRTYISVVARKNAVRCTQKL
jgi:hypothetical protein